MFECSQKTGAAHAFAGLFSSGRRENMAPLVIPRLVPELDPSFRPAALANRRFRELVAAAGHTVSLTLAFEREEGRVSFYSTGLLPAGHTQACFNFWYVERLVKFLLWRYGGWRVYVSGPPEVVRFLRWCYSDAGPRAFDMDFWGRSVYQKPFEVVAATPAELPPASRLPAKPTRLDWTGWRIGFDLGASDRKVAVVKDGRLALDGGGEPLFSEEFVWDPKDRTEPDWHFEQIMSVLRQAEARIRQVDPDAAVSAIGGSSAGVYVDGRVRVASIFRGIRDRDRFEREVAPLFRRIQSAWGHIPFRLENDGDVTALAGAIALADGAVLGLALGSSLAAGYVDGEKRIAGWMNELAFAPLDCQPEAPADEWSGDWGVGANYLSQQAVARLIPLAGLEMPDLAPADFPGRLRRVQECMAGGDSRAEKIYRTIGRYLGYAIGLYLDFYQPVRHVEVLGRVMSGPGGALILEEARAVLAVEFAAESARLNFYEPDEREKRHGQAAAAAHLPVTE